MEAVEHPHTASPLLNPFGHRRMDRALMHCTLLFCSIIRLTPSDMLGHVVIFMQ
jgi:hypothetical protein